MQRSAALLAAALPDPSVLAPVGAPWAAFAPAAAERGFRTEAERLTRGADGLAAAATSASIGLGSP